MSEQDKCPKCGAKRIYPDDLRPETPAYDCGSWVRAGDFVLSPTCKIDAQAARIAELEGERNAWRAATGLATMTPEQAGKQIDKTDTDNARRIAELEAVVERLQRIADAAIELEQLLAKEEESDSERLFHPNRITSCRALDGQRMNALLVTIRDEAALAVLAEREEEV